jgi:hypothetical protein
VALQEDWREMVVGLMDAYADGTHPKAGGRKHSQEELGETLGALIGRPKPFSDASINRFRKGTQVTDDLTEALSRFFDLKYPIVCARTPPESEWLHLGPALADADPELFRQALAAAEDLLVKARSIRKLRGDIQGTISKIAQPPVVDTDHASSPTKRAPTRRSGPRRVD